MAEANGSPVLETAGLLRELAPAPPCCSTAAAIMFGNPIDFADRVADCADRSHRLAGGEMNAVVPVSD